MCSEWSLNPLIAVDISDHTAGNSALSGIKLLASTSRFGGRSHQNLPSESSATLAYPDFNPSGRCAYPGDSEKTTFGVIFVNAPSFNTSINSLIDSRTSFITSHTTYSAVVGSLSLLRKPLLCKWSFMPANTVVIGFNSVCRWTRLRLIQVGCRQHYPVRSKQRLRSVHKIRACNY